MRKYLPYLILLPVFVSKHAFCASGFIELSEAGVARENSAYVICNGTGDFGRSTATLPDATTNNACAVMNEKLAKSPLNSPIDEFKLVGVQVGDVEMPAERSGKNPVVARVSEAIWRNGDKTECILATQLEMHDAPLANGNYFEINDIARGGFAKKKVEIAYFHKPHSNEIGGNTEVLFRAGRTFTSVPTEKQQPLPLLINENGEPPAIANNNSAGFHPNWVDFTTDISFKDDDGITRGISSIFYIKYDCDARDPVSVPNAIRLRSTGQNKAYELPISGLIPADGSVELF